MISFLEPLIINVLALAKSLYCVQLATVCDIMSHDRIVSSELETKHLLSQNDTTVTDHRAQKCCWRNSSFSHVFCLPSKAVSLILLWTVIVGFFYYNATLSAVVSYCD